MPIIRRDKDPDVVGVGDCQCDRWMIDLLMYCSPCVGWWAKYCWSIQ